MHLNSQATVELAQNNVRLQRTQLVHVLKFVPLEDETAKKGEARNTAGGMRVDNGRNGGARSVNE